MLFMRVGYYYLTSGWFVLEWMEHFVFVCCLSAACVGIKLLNGCVYSVDVVRLLLVVHA